MGVDGGEGMRIVAEAVSGRGAPLSCVAVVVDSNTSGRDCLCVVLAVVTQKAGGNIRLKSETVKQ